MMLRKPLISLLFLALVSCANISRPLRAQSAAQTAVFGYAELYRPGQDRRKILAVPDARLAGVHLKTLTAEPHLAATPGPQDR